MHTDHNPEPTEVSAGDASAQKAAVRRRLLRAGIGAAPAVLTVASMPVRATNCYTASAFASSNAAVMQTGTSANARQTNNICSGNSPSGWISNWSSCSPTYTSSPGSYFPNCIGLNTSTYCKSNGNQATLKDACNENRTDPKSVMAKYCAAAYLNLMHNKVNCQVFGSTTNADACTKLASMLLNAPSGSYVPNSMTPTVKWGVNQVCDWMNRNQIAPT